MLIEQGNGYFGFSHPTFQEYFVAQRAVEEKDLDSLLSYKFDPWWEEIILLYAAYTSNAQALFKRLVESEDNLQEEFFHTNLILAGRCLAVTPTFWESDLLRQVIKPLFRLLEHTPYSLTREQVAMALAAIGGDEVNERLLELLAQEDCNRAVRMCIVKALGEEGKQSVAAALIDLLKDDSIDREVRKNIANALGALGDRSVANPLLDLLSGMDDELRWPIAIALARIGERRIARELRRLVASANEQVKDHEHSAFPTLGADNVRHLKRLISHRQLDRDMRFSIISAFSGLDKLDVQSLCKQLADETLTASVRSCLAISLGALATEPSQAILPDSQLPQLDSGNALPYWQIPELVSSLLSLLAEQQIDREVRQCIAEALGALGDRKIARTLCAFLPREDIDPSVLSAIALTLGELGEPSVIPDLVYFLSDNHFEFSVRCSIVTALSKLSYWDSDHIVPLLQKLLRSSNLATNVRRCIAIALGKLGETSVLEELLDWFIDSKIERNERNEIAYALYMQGRQMPDRQKVVTKLLSRLDDTQHLRRQIRESIANVIGHLADDKETVSKLTSLLGKSDMNGLMECGGNTDINDSIYRALWYVSRRVDNVYVYRNKQTGQLSVEQHVEKRLQNSSSLNHV